ncbi:MAG TPA: Zn-dependent hydrolase, partial [Candidatus Dormibacteraeota bacterium]|nr:Zn-dependent hydrolase [Candidatus Dormibacteraeota bacterium]
KFDGPLGVLVAIAAVEELRRRKVTLPFALEVVGFADEEGVRYQSTYLGSKVLAGTFDTNDLNRVDSEGVTMAEALRNFGGQPNRLQASRLNSKELLGYAEVHIEQGPVLEAKNLPVGIVSAIAGQTRARLTFTGEAGHAGTVPMALRRDALCAAAEFILATENLGRSQSGLVATVGQLSVQPGAGNVIPREVILNLDVRHPQDRSRERAVLKLKQIGQSLARNRKLKQHWEIVHEAEAVACDKRLSELLADAVASLSSSDGERAGLRSEVLLTNEEVRGPARVKVLRLPSGAGHDAAAMAAITPIAMLFVRCKGGISHHPDETVKLSDIKVAVRVLTSFLERLAAYQKARGSKV